MGEVDSPHPLFSKTFHSNSTNDSCLRSAKTAGVLSQNLSQNIRLSSISELYNIGLGRGITHYYIDMWGQWYDTILHREAAGSVQVKFPSNFLYDSSTTSHSTPITVDHIMPSTTAGCVLHKRYLSHNFGPFLQLLDYRTMKIQYRKAKHITMILLWLKIDRFSLLSWIIGRLMNVQLAIDIIMNLLNGIK